MIFACITQKILFYEKKSKKNFELKMFVYRYLLILSYPVIWQSNLTKLLQFSTLPKSGRGFAGGHFDPRTESFAELGPRVGRGSILKRDFSY